MLIRLQIKINGKPFREVWRAHFDSVFAGLDRDQDGALTTEQISQVVILSGMGGSTGAESASDIEALTRLAGQSEGKITREAVWDRFSRSAPPFSARAGDGVQATSAPALFPILDADQDRQVTADEFAHIATRIAARDFDDDEIVTEIELAADPANTGALLEEESVAAPAASRVGSILVVSGDEDRQRAAAEILARYDRDGDKKLALAGEAAEIRALAEVVTALDRDADQFLDADELLAFTSRDPDVRFEIPLGRGSRDIKVHARAGLMVGRVRKATTRPVTDFGDAEIELERDNVDPSKNDTNRSLFGNVDPDNNGYLDEKEAEMVPELVGMFKAADANGDGMLVRPEFDAFIALRSQIAATHVSFEIVDKGQDLFDLVDANDDHRLTPREMRTAYASATKRDKNQDGKLSGDEIPQKVRFRVSRGGADSARSVARRRRTRDAGETGRASGGPAWFSKMDRNEDGDVSRREFLGPATAFDRIDADHDGLIDRRESEAAPGA